MPPPDFLLEQLNEAHTWLKLLVGGVVTMAIAFSALARFMYAELKAARLETKEVQSRLDVAQAARLEEQGLSLPVLGRATEVLENLVARRSRR